MSALTTWLNLGGLALDLSGAAFLAYDVLHGPEARFQAAIRRDRLRASANRARERCGLQEPSQLAHTLEERRPGREGLPAPAEAIDQTVAELRHWEKHEQRAQLHALLGLLLLMAGFLCQGVSTVLSDRVWR